jgi:hypothetical protein
MDIQKTQATPPSQLKAVQSLQTKVTDLINKAKSGDVGQVDMKTLDAWLDQAAAEVFGGAATKESFQGVRFEAMNTKSFSPNQAMEKLTTVNQQLTKLEATIKNSKGGGAEAVSTANLQNWLDDALLETISVPGFEGRTRTADRDWIDANNHIPLSPEPGDDIIRVLPSSVKSIAVPEGHSATVHTTQQGKYLMVSTGDMFFVPPGRDVPPITGGQVKQTIGTVDGFKTIDARAMTYKAPDGPPAFGGVIPYHGRPPGVIVDGQPYHFGLLDSGRLDILPGAADSGAKRALTGAERDRVLQAVQANVSEFGSGMVDWFRKSGLIK